MADNTNEDAFEEEETQLEAAADALARARQKAAPREDAADALASEVGSLRI